MLNFWEYLKCLYVGVPAIIYITLLSLLCIGVIFTLFTRRKDKWRHMGVCFVFIYLCFIYFSTILCRPSNESGFNFSPFWSYSAMFQGKDNILEQNVLNIVVFIPFGISLGIAFRNIKWLHVFLAGLAVSFSIELSQLYLKRGFSEIDDVIHNTLGCLIGFGIYKGIVHLIRNFQRTYFIKV